MFCYKLQIQRKILDRNNKSAKMFPSFNDHCKNQSSFFRFTTVSIS